jgi:hypothetical protein
MDHIDRKQLLQNLRGRGKGDASWSNPLEIKQARRFVELWSKHLIDFRPAKTQPEADLESCVDNMFEND